MIDRTVSHFRITGQLGEGGMGVVYEAEDTRLGRLVALKFLPEHLTHDRVALDRFQREARAASALNHPHICTVHDVGEADGRPFIAMERLEGAPLRAQLSRGRLAVTAVVEMAIQLADALEAAHDKGIVHRDVKPENVFVTTRETAKLLDFGVATLVAEQAAATAAGTAAWPDTGHAVVGTVAYMSPEQVRGDMVDARTDLFSLGVVLYEMATGTQPFRGATSGAVMAEILTKAPAAPIRVNPEVPADLERIVNKLLEKNRELRYQSARDVRVDLERLRRTLTASTPESALRTHHEQPSIVVLPFVNLSSDPENTFFADGLTEEIIADLSRVGSLRVISRTSAMQYKATTRPLPAIAHDLNVRYVLEGSVRRAGNSLRITAQLIDAAIDAHLWAEKYSGTLDDVFDIQERVSRAIVQALRVNLTAEEEDRMSDRPVANLAAYDCYLRARHEMWRFDEASIARAIAWAQQALDIVGDNDVLYAVMGMAYCGFVRAGVRPEASLAHAEACAAKVDSLHSRSPAAYLLRGKIRRHRSDLQQAARDFKMALADEPNNAEGLLELVYVYLAVGKVPAARPVIARLLEVDPLTTINHSLAGWADAIELRSDEALEHYRTAYQMAPENPLCRFLYAYAFTAARRADEAIAMFDELAADWPDAATGRLALLFARALRQDEAGSVEAARSLADVARWDEFYAHRLAEGYALIGKKDEALHWLEHACSKGSSHYQMLSAIWLLYSLHDDVRFQELMKRMKEQCERFEV